MKKYCKRGIAIDYNEPEQIQYYDIRELDFGNKYCKFEEEIKSLFPELLIDTVQSITSIISCVVF